MSIPFWELRNYVTNASDEDTSSSSSKVSSSNDDQDDGSKHTSTPASSNLSSSSSSSSQSLNILYVCPESRRNRENIAHTLVQRRNLSYIYYTDSNIQKGVIQPSGSYSFHVMHDNRVGVSTAKVINNYTCPLCKFNTRAFPHVWIHLNTNHCDEYTFQYKTTPDSRFHILARPIDEADSDCTRPPKGTSEVLFVEKWARFPYFPIEGTVTPQTLINLLPPNQFAYPKRPYFNIETASFYTMGQWMHEADKFHLNPEWRRQHEDDLVDEFTDLTESEKEFCKLWNGFLGGDITLFRDLSPKLHEFVEKHSKTIKEKNLYDELLSHLMNLWDHGHISAPSMHWLCRRYSELIATHENGNGYGTAVNTNGGTKRKRTND